MLFLDLLRFTIMETRVEYKIGRVLALETFSGNVWKAEVSVQYLQLLERGQFPFHGQVL